MIKLILEFFELLRFLIDAWKVRQRAKDEAWYESGKVLADKIKDCKDEASRRKLLEELNHHSDHVLG